MIEHYFGENLYNSKLFNPGDYFISFDGTDELDDELQESSDVMISLNRQKSDSKKEFLTYLRLSYKKEMEYYKEWVDKINTIDELKKFCNEVKKGTEFEKVNIENLIIN